jgi:hypothetical protein
LPCKILPQWETIHRLFQMRAVSGVEPTNAAEFWAWL